MRVVTGLFPLARGTLPICGHPLEAIDLDNKRSLFSIIFKMFHLFDGRYGLSDLEAGRMESLLARLGLEKKGQVKDRFFSTTELSSGQRKRLALASVLLEDRPILLFDEVASDFDQQSRDQYYLSLLLELKAQGRTILAISHDERYFHVAE
jgi:putative pyoverdin transport system ATP-binding/permease protein